MQAMKKTLCVLLTLTLMGCLNEPQSVEHVGKNDKFQVEYLFEKDGIKMYRFYDGGYFHYFTTGGTTLTQQHSGKNTYEESIEKSENTFKY